MLGSCVIDLTDKDSLMKLEKEKLVEIIINDTKNKKEWIDNFLSLGENELVEFQKEIRLSVGLLKILGVAR